MKTLVILCILAAVGFGVVHGEGTRSLCFSDVGDTINEGCVNCTCVLESPSNPASKVWSCVQTCNVCPAAVVSRICVYNRCDSGVYCRLDQINTTCVIPLCETCDPAFLRDGNLVNCTDKPGVCPEPVGTGNCTQLCNEDRNCPNNQKCCSNGCGTACYEPVDDTKEGMCPMPGPDVGGICAEMCSGDGACPGAEKCCSNGCGHSCQAPVPGMCPMPGPGVGGICVESCSEDGDCEGMQMCCSNGCGHSCQEPVPYMKPGMCPMPGPGVGGICVESCSGDSDCEGMQMCCSNGCGHSCQEPVPVEKVGVCPMVPPGLERNCMQKSCTSDHNCPGRKRCCEAGCEERMCLVPRPEVMCEEELPEICEFDPCEFATCPSAPDATCAPDKCGRCRPRFFNQDLEAVSCAGKTFCKALGGADGWYESGAIVDSSDGCNQCVCNGLGTWTCSKRNCDKVIQVSLTLNATFDRIMQRKDNFIGKLKMFLAMKFGLPANAMRDFKLRRGSVIVDFKVSSDATSDVNVDDAVDMMETEVSMGRFGFVYEGEEVQAKPDSFQSAPVEEMPGMAAAGPVYSAIGVMAGIVIVFMSSM